MNHDLTACEPATVSDDTSATPGADTPAPAPVWEVCERGRLDYAPTFAEMKAFTADRTADSPDTLWVLEHPPVYTLGLAGKREHLLVPSEIPVEQIDRGGQITYHGPGQVVIYTLIDLRRRQLMVRDLVARIEQAVIDTLDHWQIPGERKEGAPGVYVTLDGEQAKIAALGIKIRNGCSYHGVALNVDMDLTPFQWINPCGYAGLRTIDMATVGVRTTVQAVGAVLADRLRHWIDAGVSPCPACRPHARSADQPPTDA